MFIAIGTFFMSDILSIFTFLLLPYLHSSLLSLFYCIYVLFILSVSMHNWSAEHLCMNSIFTMAVLNGPSSFTR